MSCSTALSGRPSQFLASLRSSNLCVCNLVFKEVLEGFVYLLRWPAFDDLSFWQAMAEKLAEAAWSRQTDVISQPFGFFAEAGRECPSAKHKRGSMIKGWYCTAVQLYYCTAVQLPV